MRSRPFQFLFKDTWTSGAKNGRRKHHFLISIVCRGSQVEARVQRKKQTSYVHLFNNLLQATVTYSYGDRARQLLGVNLVQLKSSRGVPNPVQSVRFDKQEILSPFLLYAPILYVYQEKMYFMKAQFLSLQVLDSKLRAAKALEQMQMPHRKPKVRETTVKQSGQQLRLQACAVRRQATQCHMHAFTAPVPTLHATKTSHRYRGLASSALFIFLFRHF